MTSDRVDQNKGTESFDAAKAAATAAGWYENEYGDFERKLEDGSLDIPSNISATDIGAWQMLCDMEGIEVVSVQTVASDLEVLKAAADFYYDIAELYDDEDLDPEDTIAVLKAAFSSSDCDDFSYALYRLTGYRVVEQRWSGPDGFGHHSLVQAPDGRLLDVHGWIDADMLEKRYGLDRKGYSSRLEETKPNPMTDFNSHDDEGFEEGLRRIVSVIRNLPYEPFNEGWFQKLTRKELPGVDVPDSSVIASKPI